MKWEKIKQSSSTLMLVIVVSKVIGMGRDIILANYFGTSNISDAYVIASSVPVLLFYFIGHALSTAYIPMYNKVKYENNESMAMNFSNNILNISLVLSTLIVVFLLLFPQGVVRIFATGFDYETAKIAAKLIRISAPSIYLMSIVHICSGYLQANKSFLAPAAISVPRNAGIVVSIVLAATLGTDILGWGLLFSYFLEFFFLLPFVLKRNYKYRMFIDLHDENLKHTLYIVMPILLGMCVSQINKIIDRSIASTVVVGGISALSYASIINNAIQEILVTGIITILFSSCAKLVAQGKHEQVLEKLSSTIKIMVFLLIPASIGVITMARPIVQLILCRGHFNEISIEMTVGALRCYTIGLLFLAVRDTIVKVFYAYKETKITTITSIIAIIINIIFNIILSKFLGINGLALSTSISAIFHCIVLYIALRRRIGDFKTKENIVIMLKSTVASIIMGLFARSCYMYGVNILNDFLSFLLTIILSCVLYFFITFIFRCEPIVTFLKELQNERTIRK